MKVIIYVRHKERKQVPRMGACRSSGRNRQEGVRHDGQGHAAVAQ